MSEYEIVEAPSAAGLQEAVRARIASGWQPVGGITALPFQPERSELHAEGCRSWGAVPERFFQAMTRQPVAVGGGAGGMGGSNAS